MTEPNRLYRRREVAALLGVSEERMAALASRGQGPKFLKPPGHRFVLYRESDVLEWLGTPIQSPLEARARDRELAATAA